MIEYAAWIVLGLISGFIASRIVNKRGGGTLSDIVLGIVGALVGGWIFFVAVHSSVTGMNLYSISVIGAILVWSFIMHWVTQLGPMCDLRETL